MRQGCLLNREKRPYFITARRKHEIQKYKIEFPRVYQEESLFSGWRDDNFVLFALQPLSESAPLSFRLPLPGCGVSFGI